MLNERVLRPKMVRGRSPALWLPGVRRGNLAMWLTGALLCGAVVGVTVRSALESDENTAVVADWIIGTAFTVAGAWFAVKAVRSVLALSNPRTTITLESELRQGSATRMRWEIDGRREGLRRLRIALEGAVVTTQSHGNSPEGVPVTVRRVFESIELVNRAAPVPQSGSATIAVPADARASGQEESEEVVWLLRVQADVPNWVDGDDEYPVVVEPR